MSSADLDNPASCSECSAEARRVGHWWGLFSCGAGCRVRRFRRRRRAEKAARVLIRSLLADDAGDLDATLARARSLLARVVESWSDEEPAPEPKPEAVLPQVQPAPVVPARDRPLPVEHPPPGFCKGPSAWVGTVATREPTVPEPTLGAAAWYYENGQLVRR